MFQISGFRNTYPSTRVWSSSLLANEPVVAQNAKGGLCKSIVPSAASMEQAEPAVH